MPVQQQPRQRVVFTIPTPDTVFVLGSRHWNNVGYAGITGVTVEHILLKGTDPTSTVTIETPAQVVLHSTAGPLTAFAKGALLVGSESKTYIAGKSHVYIAAGASGPQHPGVGVFTDAKPGDTVAMNAVAGQVEERNKEVNLITTVAGAVGQAFSAAGILLGVQAAMESAVWASAQVVLTVGQAILSPNYNGEVYVHGAGGVVMTTMEEAAIFGVKAVSLTSPLFASMTAGIQASISGLIAAGVTGGYSGTLTGFITAEVLGGRMASLTSRFGDVNIVGKRIALGAAKPAWPQAATEVVEARAVKSVDLSVGAAGPPKSVLRADGEGVTVSGKTLTLTAESGANVASGTFGLRVATDGAALSRSLAEPAKRLVDAANAAYTATRTAADTAFSNMVNSLGARATNVPTAQILAAHTAYLAQIKAAKKALDTQLKAAAKAAAAVLRVAVTNRDAHLSNGLSKVSVDSTGKITIDAGVMPIVLKSGASQVEITPAAINIKAVAISEQ